MSQRRRSRAVALDDRILAIVRDAPWPLTTREVAAACGIRIVIRKERPPYWGSHNPVTGLWDNPMGSQCCPGCTDPGHLIERTYLHEARHVLPRLKALMRAGLVEGIVRARADGLPANYYWLRVGAPLTNADLRRLMEPES